MLASSFCSTVQVSFITLPCVWFAENFGVLLGLFWGCFSFGVFFLAKHWFPLNMLWLPALVCSGCLYVVNSLSKSYFSFSQFYIAEVDSVTQKALAESSNQKWHRQKAKRIPSSQEVNAVLHLSDSLIFLLVTLHNQQYS